MNRAGSDRANVRPSFTIRDVQPGDAAQLIELNRRLAEDGRGMVMTLDQVDGIDQERDRIENYVARPGSSVYLVAEKGNGRILGSAQIRPFRQALCRHVGVIAMGVEPEFQNLGIGRALMTTLIDRADQGDLLRLELYVRADNARAIGLYESAGFRHEGRRAGFVRLADGTLVDDLIMVRFRTGN